MRPSPSGISPLGVLLIVFGIGLGLAVSLGLYQWERELRLQVEEQATAPASPREGTSPSPTPGVPTPSSEPPTPIARPVSFSQDILLILQRSCVVCHGPAGGLTLTDYESTMNTGTNRPLIIPGKPQESLFVKRLRGKTFMPPQGPLPEQEIRLMEAWIEQGAVKN